VSFENTNSKRPFGRPRYRWVDHIRMDLRETGLENVDFMYLVRIETTDGLM
jgi:hypothetical protein